MSIVDRLPLPMNWVLYCRLSAGQGGKRGVEVHNSGAGGGNSDAQNANGQHQPPGFQCHVRNALPTAAHADAADVSAANVPAANVPANDGRPVTATARYLPANAFLLLESV